MHQTAAWQPWRRQPGPWLSALLRALRAAPARPRRLFPSVLQDPFVGREALAAYFKKVGQLVPEDIKFCVSATWRAGQPEGRAADAGGHKTLLAMSGPPAACPWAACRPGGLTRAQRAARSALLPSSEARPCAPPARPPCRPQVEDITEGDPRRCGVRWCAATPAACLHMSACRWRGLRARRCCACRGNLPTAVALPPSRHVEIADQTGTAVRFPFSRGVSFYEVGKADLRASVHAPALPPGQAAPFFPCLPGTSRPYRTHAALPARCPLALMAVPACQRRPTIVVDRLCP